MPDFGNGQTVVTDAYVESASRARSASGPVRTRLQSATSCCRATCICCFPSGRWRRAWCRTGTSASRRRERSGARTELRRRRVQRHSRRHEQQHRRRYHRGKELAARVTVQPFRGTGLRPTPQRSRLPARGLAGDSDRRSALVQDVVRPGATHLATGRRGGERNRTRVTPAAFYYYRAWARSPSTCGRRRRDGRWSRADVDNHAWEVTGSYVLTGEAASDRGVRPRRQFRPGRGSLGRLQLLARYTALTVDTRGVRGRLGGGRRQPRGTFVDAGVNWYPNPWVKMVRDGGADRVRGQRAAPRPDENIVFLRVPARVLTAVPQAIPFRDPKARIVAIQIRRIPGRDLRPESSEIRGFSTERNTARLVLYLRQPPTPRSDRLG